MSVTVVETFKLICKGCQTPVAEVQGDMLILRVNHHSEVHVTRIPLEDLTKLATYAHNLNGTQNLAP